MKFLVSLPKFKGKSLANRLNGRKSNSNDMNQSKPEDTSPGGNRTQPTPQEIRYDLGAMLKANPQLCRVWPITRVQVAYLGLDLLTRVAFNFASFGIDISIICVNAVDYSIRPPDPAIIMGGPFMEFHEHHPLLENISQDVPNSDGLEFYDPPVKFGLLNIDQSYIIAGQFGLRIYDGNGFTNVSDLEERRRRVAALQIGLEWMKPFRLMELKRFTRRTIEIS